MKCGGYEPLTLNSEQLEPLHSWFRESLAILLGKGDFKYSTNIVQTPEGESAIRSMMASADIVISSIRAATSPDSLSKVIGFDKESGILEISRQTEEFIFPIFTHRVGTISAEFQYFDESEGTQKLFALAGPLHDILKKGKVLIIDELDSSLHSLLVRHIVGIFQDSALNPRGAQLLFTAHNTTLFDQKFLRRDQIWLVEKTIEQSSILVPLTEFSPRKGEALEKGYLEGRYGGVPVLG